MKKSSTDCEGGQRAIAAYNWRYFDAATPKQTEELAAQQARATPKSCSCQASVLQPASEARWFFKEPARRRPFGELHSTREDAPATPPTTRHTLRHEGLVLVPEGHRAPARRRFRTIKALGVALVVRRDHGVEGRLARREE